MFFRNNFQPAAFSASGDCNLEPEPKRCPFLQQAGAAPEGSERRLGLQN